MRLHQVSVDKHVHEYISPKLCLTSELKSKYFRIGECVGIGQTTVILSQFVFKILVSLTRYFSVSIDLWNKLVKMKVRYSRNSMARTPMARLPRLFRTRSL